MDKVKTGYIFIAIAAATSGCAPLQPMSFDTVSDTTNKAAGNCIVYTDSMSNPRAAALNKLLTMDIKNEASEVKVEALRTFSITAKHLYKQAHSIQLFRDASFALCNAYYAGTESDDFSYSISTLLSVLETSTSDSAVSKESIDNLSTTQLQAIHNEILEAKDSWDDVIRESSKHSAYMMAQMYITKMAFENLNQENQYSYQVDDTELEPLKTYSLVSTETGNETIGNADGK